MAVLLRTVAEAERAVLRVVRLGPVAVAVAVAVTLALAACTGSPGGTSTTSTVSTSTVSTGSQPGPSPSATTSTSATTSAAPSRPPSPAARGVDKVLVFVVENHSAAQMADQMPYAASLGKRYAVATAYTATTHPSLPNYLVMAGGSTFGVRDDASPSAHPLPGRSVFGLALDHGRTAGLFAEGMTGTCQLTPQGRYAPKHNPWAYFADERAACRRFDRPLADLGPAITRGTLPSVGMVIPDLCNDAHDCSLAGADRWFAAWMRRVQAGPDWRSGRLLVVLTADEDDKHAGNRVLTVFANPALHHRVVRTPLTHFSLAALLAAAGGAAPPRSAASAPSIATALGLRVS